MAIKFYTDLFPLDPEAGGNFIIGKFPSLEQDVMQKLEATYTSKEVCGALMGMGSLKALGPDEFQALFFKKTWAKIGPALTEFVLGVRRGEMSPKEESGALLVLIPKKVEPMTIREFRPISLCNVSIKLVTKLILNRLKVVLDDLVSPNQSSFIPG